MILSSFAIGISVRYFYRVSEDVVGFTVKACRDGKASFTIVLVLSLLEVGTSTWTSIILQAVWLNYNRAMAASTSPASVAVTTTAVMTAVTATAATTATATATGAPMTGTAVSSSAKPNDGVGLQAEATALATSTSTCTVAAIADAFDIFDHGGNRTIDVRELGTVLRYLGNYPGRAHSIFSTNFRDTSK